MRLAIAVDEYSIAEVRTRSASHAIGMHPLQQEHRYHDLEATIYVDRKRGRGTAGLVPDMAADVAKQIQETSARAFGALGVAWQLPAPAAPARVVVDDPELHVAPLGSAQHITSEFIASLPATLKALQAEVKVEHRVHRALLSNGFDNQFQSTMLTVSARVQADGGTPIPLELRARRISDLPLETAAQKALQRSLDGPKAAIPEAGRYDLVLEGQSYQPTSINDFGIWTPLVTQASAALLRAGLSTHNPGHALLPRPARGDELSLASVGTQDYGLRSAPFSRDGEAVRDFTLVDAGQAIGTSVHHRESALGAGPANGGVRRLVVGAGKTASSELYRPSVRPLLVAHRLGPIRSTGQGRVFFEIESGLMLDRDALGKVRRTPIRSALVCGDIRDWLGDAYFSRETEDANWVVGPRTIRFSNVNVQ